MSFNKMLKMNNFSVLLLLVLVGLLVHYQTFKFALFGDDWMAIYLFLSQDNSGGFFGSLPGVLKYLTQYGNQVLMTGIFYKIFGNSYPFYYLISVLFRVFASFSLFLVLKKISEKEGDKYDSKILAVLGSLLFLTGVAGIQTTDFIVQMGVYLAAGFSMLGLYFLILSYLNNSKVYLAISFISALLALVIAPYRLFYFVFVYLAEIFLIGKLMGTKLYSGKTLLLALSWVISVAIFWAVGLFSAPGQIASSYTQSINNFYFAVLNNPLGIIYTALQWIGAIILPDLAFDKKYIQISSAILFLNLTVFSIIFLKKASLKLFAAFIPFSISFVLMFSYSFNRLMSTEDRYLIMIFYNLCMFFPILDLSLLNSKFSIANLLGKTLFAALVILVVVNAAFLDKLYTLHLQNGRSASFISKTEEIISKDFNQEINSPKFIFLDFDNSQTLYYIQYGLDFKLLVMTKTLNQSNFPTVSIDKGELINSINNTIFKNPSEKDASVFSYSYKSGKFYNSTGEFRRSLWQN